MSGTDFLRTLLRHARLFRLDRSTTGVDWPALQVSREFCPELDHLQRFLTICPGWDIPEFLPLTYPQVAAVDLHLRLLGDRGFPWHPMGLVHLSNSIEVLAPLAVNRNYRLSARLTPAGEHHKGILVNIETTLQADGQLIWRSNAVALKVTKDIDKASEPAPDIPPLSAVQSVELPEDLGRRYARVAGDLNPIHQRAWMARPFGFRRHILHGMWTLGWAIQPLVATRLDQSCRIEARFLRPVFLPGIAHLGIREQGNDLYGQLWASEAMRPNLVFEINNEA